MSTSTGRSNNSSRYQHHNHQNQHSRHHSRDTSISTSVTTSTSVSGLHKLDKQMYSHQFGTYASSHSKNISQTQLETLNEMQSVRVANDLNLEQIASNKSKTNNNNNYVFNAINNYNIFNKNSGNNNNHFGYKKSRSKTASNQSSSNRDRYMIYYGNHSVRSI